MIDRISIEKKLWSEGYQQIMGLDEVGRGCLAGPVVAAGVIFEPGTFIPEIRDSKKMKEAERQELSTLIKQKAKFWVIKEGSTSEIERLNILWASIATMQRCAEFGEPDFLLVDGNRYTSSLIPYHCIIKGDDKSMSIGAASILAKVYRDELMIGLHTDFPEFGWDSNVGYPTPKHKNALLQFGVTKHHRTSFKLGTTIPYKKASDRY